MSVHFHSGLNSVISQKIGAESVVAFKMETVCKPTSTDFLWNHVHVAPPSVQLSKRLIKVPHHITTVYSSC